MGSVQGKEIEFIEFADIQTEVDISDDTNFRKVIYFSISDATVCLPIHIS